jgi:branched-chain amino acid transport system substrate-binding protein
MGKKNTRRLATVGTAMMLCLGLVTAGNSVIAAGAATKVPGVTARQITIGATVPLSGIASTGYSDVGKAANAVFKYVNSKGGVNGRKIKFVLKDDCYGVPGSGCTSNPSTTAQTRALLALPVFATVGSLGTPTQDSVRSLLKSNGVPQLFVNSGSRDWNNPKVYPGLYGWQTSYNVEGKIFGQYIKATFPTAKVCFLGQDDDFGANGLAGLQAGGVTPIDIQMYSVQALVQTTGASVGPYVAKFQADNCTVTVLDTIPGATDAVLGAALKLGFKTQWVISSVGSDPVTVNLPFAALHLPFVPEKGAISFTFLPASTDPSPWNAWMTKVLAADNSDFPNFVANNSVVTGNMAYGIGWGVAFVEALKAAGKNFTRASFLKTLTNTSFQTPALVPLEYSNANHQGLSGGYLDVIKSGTETAAIDYRVYTTTSSDTSPIVLSKRNVPGIPGWLK